MTTFETIISNVKSEAFPAVVLIWLFFSAALPCFAQESPAMLFDPEGGEIRISSDKMIMQTGGNKAEFIGNVHAVQGETSVRSKKMEIFYKSDTAGGKENGGMSEESIERIEAAGDVVIESRNTTATAETATYTAEDGLLKLFGNPARLESEESVVTGSQVIMHRDTGEVEVSGEKGQRVEAVLKPASESGRDESEDQQRGRTD